MKRFTVGLSLVLGAGLLVTSGPGLMAKTKALKLRPKNLAASYAAPAAAPSNAEQTSQLSDSSKKAAIVILETRENRVTVYSNQGDFRYTIATENGIPLAEQLTATELKARFPELYDIVTGTAWAGM